MTATQTSPRHIVQHTTAGRCQVVPSGSCRPVDGGADLTTDEAFKLRNELNGDTPAVAPVIARPKPLDHLRKGENKPARVGRAARVRVGNHWQRAMIAARNSGRTLARDFLASLGLDSEWIAKYESAFGRKVAAVYRENHDAEPDDRGLVWLRGRLWHSNRYADLADLIAGAKAYPRTAALIGA